MAKLTHGLDGKILHTELSSEEASEMARARWAKPKAQTMGSLLSEAGFSNVDDAPSHLKLLAEFAASGRSGSVYALRTFLAMTGRDTGAPIDSMDVAPGERCPTCGRIMPVDIDADILEELLLIVRNKLADARREN